MASFYFLFTIQFNFSRIALDQEEKNIILHLFKYMPFSSSCSIEVGTTQIFIPRISAFFLNLPKSHKNMPNFISCIECFFLFYQKKLSGIFCDNFKLYIGNYRVTLPSVWKYESCTTKLHNSHWTSYLVHEASTWSGQSRRFYYITSKTIPNARAFLIVLPGPVCNFLHFLVNSIFTVKKWVWQGTNFDRLS